MNPIRTTPGGDCTPAATSTSTSTSTSTPTTCQENTFSGPNPGHNGGATTTAFPASGSTVTVGQNIGAVYNDEHGLATAVNEGQVINGITVHAPQFTMTNTATSTVTQLTPTITFTQGAAGDTGTVQATISSTVPTVPAGAYSIALKAWDLDQNAKPDCGNVTWNLSVASTPPPPDCDGNTDNSNPATDADCAPPVPPCTDHPGENTFLPNNLADGTVSGWINPADGSTVHPGDTVSAIYHDETPFLDANGGTAPSALHQFSFTLTGPQNINLAPVATFTTLPQGYGYDVSGVDADGDPYIAPADRQPGVDPHPDQEFDHVVKISAVVPADLSQAGAYMVHLSALDGDQNRAGGDCGTANWHLTLAPAFTITKTVDAGDGTSVAVGTPLKYTVTVTDNSNIDGTPPAVHDTISGDAPYALTSGPTASQGSVTGATGNWAWSVGSLLAHHSATLTVTVTPTGGGLITNAAVLGSGPPVIVHNPVPTFALHKSVAEGNGTQVSVGTALHYSVTVSNTSSVDGVPADVVDTLSGLTFTVDSGPTVSQGTVAPGPAPATATSRQWTWHVGNLTAHATATLTLTATPTAPGTLTNIAVMGDQEKSVQNPVIPLPGGIHAVIDICAPGNVDGGTAPAGGMIAIPATSAATPSAPPVDVTTAPGPYNVNATPPQHYGLVDCGQLGGGTVNPAHTAATQAVTVVTNATQNVTFYVSPNPGTLVGEIHVCAAGNTDGGAAPTGGTIAVPGTSDAGGTSTLPVSLSLAPGPYTLDATPPANYSMVDCGPLGGGTVTTATSATEGAEVISDATKTVVFYVQANPGTLTGQIHVCGVENTDAGPAPAGGSIAIPGTTDSAGTTSLPVTVSATPSTVPYNVNATAPLNYTMVVCGPLGGGTVTSPTSATQAATVTPGSAQTVTFYVTPNPGHITGQIHVCGAGNTDAGAAPAGGTVAIPGTTDAAGTATLPVTVSAEPSTTPYSVNATPPANYSLVDCGPLGGGTVTLPTSATEPVTVTPGSSQTVTFYVTPNPGTITGIILVCNSDGSVGPAAPAGGVITIPNSTDALGTSALPVTVTVPPGTYTASATPGTGFKLVDCGAGGGTVTGGGTGATQGGIVVTPGQNVPVTFYVVLLGGGQQGATTTSRAAPAAPPSATPARAAATN